MAIWTMRRTEALQGQVEEFNSGLAAHASDALGNVAVIQSFTRAKAEKDAVGATALQRIARRGARFLAQEQPQVRKVGAQSR